MTVTHDHSFDLPVLIPEVAKASISEKKRSQTPCRTMDIVSKKEKEVNTQMDAQVVPHREVDKIKWKI